MNKRELPSFLAFAFALMGVAPIHAQDAVDSGYDLVFAQATPVPNVGSGLRAPPPPASIGSTAVRSGVPQNLTPAVIKAVQVNVMPNTDHRGPCPVNYSFSVQIQANSVPVSGVFKALVVFSDSPGLTQTVMVPLNGLQGSYTYTHNFAAPSGQGVFVWSRFTIADQPTIAYQTPIEALICQ